MKQTGISPFARVAVVIALSACSRQPAPQPQPPAAAPLATATATAAQVPAAPAATTSALPAAAAGALPALAASDGEKPGVRVEVTELKRSSGGTVNLKFTMINASDGPVSFDYNFVDKDHEVTDFGPVTARFAVRIDRPIRNGHHGILLYDRDGRVLWGTGTDNIALDAGLYEIVYDLEGLSLRPGPYRWHVSLYDEGHFIDDLECVPEMSVRTPPLGHRRDRRV